MNDLVVFGGPVPTYLIESIQTQLRPVAIRPQGVQAIRFTDIATDAVPDSIRAGLNNEQLDWALAPSGRTLNDFKLVVFDMDSTLINIECIDELADFAGRKAEVSEITEAAMRGEMDYRESLQKRVGVLAGLDARVLARVFSERLLLNPGARELLDALQNASIHTALLSGGFTYFTERLRIELGLDFATSNELEIVSGKLTGRVVGPIIDAQAKAETLLELTREFGLERNQVMAVGDGANDLLMMAEAGTSVAYHAKPATQAKATHAINHAGLDALLTIYPSSPPA
ncbi:MAG: phosphoserine phosphatase SerB [Rhodocyclaceae bacterium]|jgi:phosphoserine phosphatase|nr:phosphoserine phosphatase SerB [Rhodocyclaceae bacterium]